MNVNGSERVVRLRMQAEYPESYETCPACGGNPRHQWHCALCATTGRTTHIGAELWRRDKVAAFDEGEA